MANVSSLLYRNGANSIQQWKKLAYSEMLRIAMRMTKADADIVAGTFQSLIQGYTIEQALAALTEDFVDYSSAVSIVINKGAAVPSDITQPIFTSREQFMLGHGKQ